MQVTLSEALCTFAPENEAKDDTNTLSPKLRCLHRAASSHQCPIQETPELYPSRILKTFFRSLSRGLTKSENLELGDPLVGLPSLAQFALACWWDEILSVLLQSLDYPFLFPPSHYYESERQFLFLVFCVYCVINKIIYVVVNIIVVKWLENLMQKAFVGSKLRQLRRDEAKLRQKWLLLGSALPMSTC